MKIQLPLRLDASIGDSDDLANNRDVYRLQRPPLGIAGVPVLSLFNIRYVLNYRPTLYWHIQHTFENNHSSQYAAL